ncbi:MAG: 4a-hydroxytetrahydrobiopterin dehydratase [Thaumarchaeota archaeon]|nr:4a-hydroxytetrahydrobiopterin dehydratase [Nitrososphaerota archaeon]
MTRLSESHIKGRLKGLHGWKYRNNFLTKAFEFKTFMAGIRFVNDIAAIAEKLDHHPDIHIRWTTIKLSVQSHDEGGVTSRDVRLVTEIEKFLHRKTG